MIRGSNDTSRGLMNLYVYRRDRLDPLFRYEFGAQE